MIWLTIIFIAVSVLGGAFVINIFQNLGDFGSSWLAKFLENFSSILKK